MSNESSGPIFVVGPSRSGTALVRSILNEHPRIHLAGETHYFEDLRAELPDPANGQLSGELETRAQNYFLALSHRPYGHQGDPERGSIKRDELVAALNGTAPTGDTYFEAFCRISAQREGKERWGEKTPRHVFYIADIVKRYPEAKVICLVRDPRAVVASYKNWRNQGGFDLDQDPTHEEALVVEERRAKRSYHPITASLVWKGAARAASQAVKALGPNRVRIVRYEDLTANGEETAKALCDWLGESYSDALLEVPVHNSSFMTYEKKSGIVAGSVDRWKKVMTPGEVALVEWCCGEVLTEAGYERSTSGRPGPSALGPLLSWPISVVTALWANRSRYHSLWGYVGRRLKVTIMP